MCDACTHGWLHLLTPSIPSTVAIIVGFWAFHYFALKRQKRQEIFEDIKRLHALLDECIKAADEAWKLSGKKAVESGAVMLLRGKLVQLSNVAENLIEKDIYFFGLREAVSSFRKGVDEKLDINGSPTTTVDDVNRTDGSCPFEAVEGASKIRRAADRAFNQKNR